MNTVQTVQAWLQLAPSLIALVAALESLFPHKTGPVKLAAFQNIAMQAVAQTVPEPDHATLQVLNTAFATEQVAKRNWEQGPESAKTVQEIA